jgi:hypothetical protein
VREQCVSRVSRSVPAAASALLPSSLYRFNPCCSLDSTDSSAVITRVCPSTRVFKHTPLRIGLLGR